MILSELLSCTVHAGGHRVGRVVDVRLIPAQVSGHGAPELRIYGFIVSPHARSSTLGYERSNARGPAAIAAFERWHHRDSFLVRWSDVAGIVDRTIELRPEHRRYSPALVVSAVPGPDDDQRQH